MYKFSDFCCRHIISCFEQEHDNNGWITMWDRHDILQRLQEWLQDQNDIVIQKHGAQYSIILFNHWRDKIWQFYFDSLDTIPEYDNTYINYPLALLNNIRQLTIFNRRPVYTMRFSLARVRKYLANIYVNLFLNIDSYYCDYLETFLIKTRHSNINQFISDDNFKSMQIYSKIMSFKHQRNSEVFNTVISNFDSFKPHDLLSKFAYDTCNHVLRWRCKDISILNSCELIKKIVITDEEQKVSLDNRLAKAFIKVTASLKN